MYFSHHIDDRVYSVFSWLVYCSRAEQNNADYGSEFQLQDGLAERTVDYCRDDKLQARPEQDRLVFPKYTCVPEGFCFCRFAYTKTCHMFLPCSQSIPSNQENLDLVQTYLPSPKNVLLLVLVFFLPCLYFIGQAPVAQLSRSKSPIKVTSCNGAEKSTLASILLYSSLVISSYGGREKLWST